MKSNKKKIIVTGGAGFIGSHTVVELAKQGYEPIIIDNFSNSEERILERLKNILGHPVKYYRADCNDRERLEQLFCTIQNIHGLIHFAAFKAVGESMEKPKLYYHNNISSMKSIMAVMKAYRVAHLVFSSSCTVYGEPDEIPVHEQTPLKVATSPYGETKQHCETLLFEAQKNAVGTFNSVILRYFNPIGAHKSGLIGELPTGTPNNLTPYIAQVAAKRRKELTVYGGDYNTPDGTCIRDYIHVVDLAKAHVKALEWLETTYNACEVFNLGTGRGYSVLEVIHAFEKVNKIQLPYHIGPRRAGDIVRIYADAGKARKELNWKAEIPLSIAMKDLWRWEQNNPV